MNIETELPYSDEAEKAVIGAMMTGGDIDAVTAEVGLTENDFYIDRNKAVFRAVISEYNSGKNVDLVTIDAALKNNPSYEGLQFLKSVVSAVVTVTNLKYYAEIVREMSLRRRYISVAREIQKAAADTSRKISDVSELAETLIDSETDGVKLTRFNDLIVPTYNSIIKAYEKKGEIPGQKTGWKTLDLTLGGLEGLVVVGARPSMGKTMFGVNIAEYAAFCEKKNVLLFSLEMSEKQIATRILSSQAWVKHSDCKYGTLTADDFRALGGVLNRLNEEKTLFISDEPYIGVGKIKSIARKIAKKYGSLGLIVIDYLQLIALSDKRGQTKADAVGDASRSLKILSKELNCPIVLLSQLSRKAEERLDKRPMLSDLRDSGAIEQDADSVLFLYRDDYYNRGGTKNGIAEVIIAKARHGETATAELSFQPQIMKFMEKSEVRRMKKEAEKNGQNKDFSAGADIA